jgi:two-component sensor histidine kinase
MTNDKSVRGDEASVNNEILESDTYDQNLNQLQDLEEKFEKEKETILNEMRHRFKNNLQVIASLLSLQGDYVKDKESRRMFSNSSERVKTIALMYDKLYQADKQDGIYFDKYLIDLVNYHFQNYNTNPNMIRHQIKGDDLILPIKTAIPCGLIITELILNSLKHAFPDNRSGNIKINLEHPAGECILSIEDDGIGLPEEFDIGNNDSLEFLLVRSLSEQINGTLKLTGINGTKFVLKFPVDDK